MTDRIKQWLEQTPEINIQKALENASRKPISFEERQTHLNQVIANVDILIEQPIILGYDPQDPFGRAKDGALQILKFVKILAEQHRLSPAEVVFMFYLFIYVEYNSPEIKMTLDKFNEITKQAREYYFKIKTQKRATFPSVQFPNDWTNAIKNTKRLIQYTRILVRETNLDAVNLFYAIELAYTNFCGLEDFPMNLNDQKRIEQQVEAFYERNI